MLPRKCSHPQESCGDSLSSCCGVKLLPCGGCKTFALEASVDKTVGPTLKPEALFQVYLHFLRRDGTVHADAGGRCFQAEARAVPLDMSCSTLRGVSRGSAWDFIFEDGGTQFKSWSHGTGDKRLRPFLCALGALPHHHHHHQRQPEPRSLVLLAESSK